jgi:hypothetical protein
MLAAWMALERIFLVGCPVGLHRYGKRGHRTFRLLDIPASRHFMSAPLGC